MYLARIYNYKDADAESQRFFDYSLTEVIRHLKALASDEDTLRACEIDVFDKDSNLVATKPCGSSRFSHIEIKEA